MYLAFFLTRVLQGYPRAQTNPSGHENVPPKLTQIDEALLSKLHSYFPKVDTDYIRSLLHKCVLHCMLPS